MVAECMQIEFMRRWSEMEQEKLKKILRKHKFWIERVHGGEEANLTEANLTEADLRKADLRMVNLIGADLRGADLTRTDLRGADLRGADLDFSCIPLWCGSLEVHFDDRQLYQLAYHLVRAGLYSKNASEETKDELSKLIDFANKFHRVEECGEIKLEEMMK